MVTVWPIFIAEMTIWLIIFDGKIFDNSMRKFFKKMEKKEENENARLIAVIEMNISRILEEFFS